MLTKLKEEKNMGDYPVCVDGISPIHIDLLPYFYDGGYIVRDMKKSQNDYLRARTLIGNIPEIKSQYISIIVLNPRDTEDGTIDGLSVSY